jgi:hypothetical protein
MSIGNVTAVNGTTQAAPVSQGSPYKKIRQDFDAVGQALSGGDLGAAQQAFATFQQDLQSVAAAKAPGQSGDTANGNVASPADALSALGQALNAGDLGAAQKAYAALQQNVQGAGGGHRHHHHHHQAAASTPAGTSGTAGTASQSPTGAGSIDVKA